MSSKLERLPLVTLLGEGPHWDEETSSLYFTDAFGKAIHKYTPSTNSHSKASGEKGITFIIPVAGRPGKFVISYSEEICLIEWDGKSERFAVLKTLAKLSATGEEGEKAELTAEQLAGLETFSKLITNGAPYVWNDGKPDSAGRVWSGSISLKPENKRGSLYVLISGKTLKEQADDIGLSNGLAWDDNLGKLYYIDSFRGVIFQFDYNANDDSALTNRKAIFSLKDHDAKGTLDGVTIDDEGNLWVACFGIGKVIKVDPRRPDAILQTIEIPTEQVTSVAFGGENLDELYVTTGNLDMKQPDRSLKDGPEHGAIYRITGLGVKGLRANKVTL